MENYRRIIERYSDSPAAPIAVERLLWLYRDNQDRQRMDRLNALSVYFNQIADTTRSRYLG